ncbi:hypothetical protein SAY86_031132 [Trapa natans]|uniref:Uncharacterized protein n=1 Tax=Trapa natans TaxID=22666 RepID=A0AAN7M451_TRANT|nr:hypothetical protein SAY86_031132 [Trapa natans]
MSSRSPRIITLFCLRVQSASFNFPGSLPDVITVTENHRNLTHQEIQAVAARYANQHRAGDVGGGGCGGGERQDMIMDWSFLGAVDESQPRVSGLGFSSEVEYMAVDEDQLHAPWALDGHILRGADDDRHYCNDYNDAPARASGFLQEGYADLVASKYQDQDRKDLGGGSRFENRNRIRIGRATETVD